MFANFKLNVRPVVMIDVLIALMRSDIEIVSVHGDNLNLPRSMREYKSLLQVRDRPGSALMIFIP